MSYKIKSYCIYKIIIIIEDNILINLMYNYNLLRILLQKNINLLYV